MILDFSIDFRTWDNVEAVQYRSSRQLAGPFDLIPVAKQRKLTNKELAASGGVYTGIDRVWTIPQAMFSQGIVPKPADVIVDAQARRWTVLQAEAAKQEETWRLTCRDLVLANDLTDSITIERATITYDHSGVAIKTFAPVCVGIAARVQPEHSDIVDERGIRGFKTVVQIIIGQEVSVTNEDRVTLGAVHYEIRGYHNSKRIDELPVIDCELVP